MYICIYIYLNKVLIKSWSVNHRVQDGLNKKTHKKSQEIF